MSSTAIDMSSEFPTIPANRPQTGLGPLVRSIVQALVDEPDAVEVNEIEGTHSAVLELRVARSDLGKVIGKRGVHAQALRTLVGAAGGKLKKRYILEIIED